jgi:hypothetical protein
MVHLVQQMWWSQRIMTLQCKNVLKVQIGTAGNETAIHFSPRIPPKNDENRAGIEWFCGLIGNHHSASKPSGQFQTESFIFW